MLGIHVLFVRPALAHSGDLHWQGNEWSLRGTPVGSVIEKVASRDYTYLLLVLALVGHLEWFLYAAAAGSWLFAGGLVVYALCRPRRSAARPAPAPVGGGGGVSASRRWAGRGPSWLEAAFLLVGLAVLGVTLWRIGVAGLLHDLSTIGWGLLPILLVESVTVVLNTCGWALAFPAGERSVGPWRLLTLRLAGDGVNYLTPSATVGGELIRIRLLERYEEPSLAWASVGAAKVGQAVGQAVFVCLGLGLVLPSLIGASPWAGILAGAAGAIALSWGFVWLIGRGFWRTIAGVARRLALGRFLPTAWAESGREIDAMLSRLGAGRTVAVLGCFVGGWAVGAVEIAVILYWLGTPVDWWVALAVETGSVLIDGILFVVPAKVGTQEGGKVLLFSTLGLDPARGLTVGVVRRIRELAYAGLGLGVLAWLTGREAALKSSPRAGLALGPRSRSHV